MTAAEENGAVLESASSGVDGADGKDGAGAERGADFADAALVTAGLDFDADLFFGEIGMLKWLVA